MKNKTIDILYSLKTGLASNRISLSNNDWNDIFCCIDIELNIRKHLYPRDQFERIKEQIYSHLYYAKEQGDAFSFSQAVDKIANIFEILPETEYTSAEYESNNFAKAYYRHRAKNTTIVLGDSHTNFFSGNELLKFIPIGNGINTCENIGQDEYTILHIGPGLAYTCCNENSKTNTYNKVKFLCDEFIDEGASVIVSLGEIDIRVHILKQSELQENSIKEIILSVIDNYVKLLRMLKRKGYKVTCFAPIASQKDDNPPDPNFPAYGSEKIRNDITRIFNDELQNRCAENGITYISIFNKMLDEDGLTKKEYISTDGCHLSQKAWELFDK